MLRETGEGPGAFTFRAPYRASWAAPSLRLSAEDLALLTS